MNTTFTMNFTVNVLILESCIVCALHSKKQFSNIHFLVTCHAYQASEKCNKLSCVPNVISVFCESVILSVHLEICFMQ